MPLGTSVLGLADLAAALSPRAEMSVHLLVALALCWAIGFERELRGSAAGDRTFALVGIGSAVIGYLALDGAPNALAGVVTGIGFLGAGTIIKHEFNVEGLTTAATLWAVTGVGLACGTGHYFLAVVGTATIWGVLKVLRGLESQVRSHNGREGTHPKS